MTCDSDYSTHKALKVKKAIRRGIVRHFGPDLRCQTLHLDATVLATLLWCPHTNGIDVTKYPTILLQDVGGIKKTTEKHVYTVSERQPLALTGHSKSKQVGLERLVTRCHVSLSPDEIGQHND